MRRGIRRLSVLAAMGLVLSLTACQGGGSVDPQDLYDEAKAVNTTFKEAVGAVQLQVFDGEWTVEQYGDIPRGCGSEGYEFRLGRATPDGWRLAAEPLDAAKSLGAWMDGEGWEDVSVKTFDGEIEDVTLVAARTEAHVSEIVVDFTPGELFDNVTVRATSTCEPGSWADLLQELVPGAPSEPPPGISRPSAERPDATPLFGFTADGTPRG